MAYPEAAATIRKITPASGEEIEEMVRKILTTPKALAAKTRAALYNEPM